MLPLRLFHRSIYKFTTGLLFLLDILKRDVWHHPLKLPLVVFLCTIIYFVDHLSLVWLNLICWSIIYTMHYLFISHCNGGYFMYIYQINPEIRIHSSSSTYLLSFEYVSSEIAEIFLLSDFKIMETSCAGLYISHAFSIKNHL